MIAREERIRVMKDVVGKLQKEQSIFEVLSDADFYASPHGEIRRMQGHEAAELVFFHVLIPGSKRDLFKAYFQKNRVAYALTKVLGDNLEELNTNVSFSKSRPKDRYWELSISIENPDEMLDLGLELSRDLMKLAVKANPTWGAWKKTEGINSPMAPKNIIEISEGVFHYICGNCGHEYVKAARCPECGQLVDDQMRS